MPRSLEVGYALFIQSAGQFFRVSDVNEFNLPVSVALTASQTLSNQEITDLKSSTDQIYHVRSIGLEDDVSLQLKWRNRAQFGTKAPQSIAIDDAPEDVPMEVDMWLYNYSMFYDVTENAGIAKTAVIHFNGEVYDLELIGKEYKGPSFSIVEG